MEKEGSKRIEIAGIDDKRQLTVVFAGMLAGNFSLFSSCIRPKLQNVCLQLSSFLLTGVFPTLPIIGQMNKTMNEYLKRVILPYVVKKKEEVHRQEDHQTLVIFDFFKEQCTEEFFKLLESHYISYALVPANCTDRL